MTRTLFLTASIFVLCTGIALSQSRFTRVIRDGSGNPITGASVKLYTAGTTYLRYTLTEDMSAPGTYYKDNVTPGTYDVYVNNVKKQSNSYHADATKAGNYSVHNKHLLEGRYFVIEGADHWGLNFDSTRISGDTVIIRMKVDRTKLSQILSDSGVIVPAKFGIQGNTTSKTNHSIRGNGASGLDFSSIVSGDTSIVEVTTNPSIIASSTRSILSIVDSSNRISAADDSVQIWYLSELKPITIRYTRPIVNKDSMTNNRIGYKEYFIITQTSLTNDLRGMKFFSDSSNKVCITNVEWQGNTWAVDNNTPPSYYGQTSSGSFGRFNWNSATFTSQAHTEANPSGTAFTPLFQLIAASSSYIGMIDQGNGQRLWTCQMRASSTAATTFLIRLKIWYQIPQGSSSSWYVGMASGL